jgi:hypothetical protein
MYSNKPMVVYGSLSYMYFHIVVLVWVVIHTAHCSRPKAGFRNDNIEQLRNPPVFIYYNTTPQLIHIRLLRAHSYTLLNL